MKKLALLAVFLALPLFGQTAKPAATTPVTPTGDTFNITFNLAPVTLPGLGASVTGAETDALLPITTNNWFGMSTIASTQYSFVGGKYNRMFPQLTNWLAKQNTMFASLECGLTGSVGVLSANSQSHWGETAGPMCLANISGTWAMGFDVEAVRFPGVQSGWGYKVAIGPTIKF